MSTVSAHMFIVNAVQALHLHDVLLPQGSLATPSCTVPTTPNQHQHVLFLAFSLHVVL